MGGEEASARAAHDQLRRDGLHRRCRLAAGQGESDLQRPAAHLRERRLDRGEFDGTGVDVHPAGRRGDQLVAPGVLVPEVMGADVGPVVEADHRHVGRGPDTGRLQRGQDAQRQVVVRSGDRAGRLGEPVEHLADGLGGDVGIPVPVSRRRDDIGVDRQPVRAEGVEVALVPLLRAAVVLRPPDEPDPALAVRLDEVAHRLGHATPVVHQYRRPASHRPLDAHDRHRLVPPHEPLQLGVRQEQADPRRPDHQRIDALAGHQVVDRVGPADQAVRVPLLGTHEADQVAAGRPGGVADAQPLLLAVLQDRAGGHHSNDRPRSGPLR